MPASAKLLGFWSLSYQSQNQVAQIQAETTGLCSTHVDVLPS